MPNYGRRFVSNTELSQIERSFLKSIGSSMPATVIEAHRKRSNPSIQPNKKFDRSMVLFEQIDIWLV